MSRRGFSTTGPILLRYAAAMATAVPLTMAAWGKTSVTGSQQYMLGLFRAAAATDRDNFALRISGSNEVAAQTCDNAAASTALSSTTISANTWFHAAAVFTSATDRAAFLNGGGKGTNATSRTPAGIDRTSIGLQDNAAANRAFANGGTGDLAEVGLWSAALTDAEIAILAAGISPLAVRPASLIGYWPLLGVNSPEDNIVSNVSVMSLVGAPTQAAHPRIIRPRARTPVMG